MYVDLHIHSKFAGGTSKNLSIEKLSEYSALKGLDAIGTGDILHKTWLKEFEESLEKKDGCLFYGKTAFFLQTEVETKDRVHHLIIFPDFDAVYKTRNLLMEYGSLDSILDGRPRLRISSKELYEKIKELEVLFGPAHAFTPYFSVYAHYDSIKKAYGSYDIDFLELGLSADSYMANNISELKEIAFLSNSDAHSFWPHRLGREFNDIILEKANYKELKKALAKWKENIKRNIGLNPKEGKYHKTACNKCYKKYSLKEAIAKNWKCTCKGKIKKGVMERIEEISYKKEAYNRPEYLHILPLSEIIAFAMKSNVMSKKVQNKWLAFVKEFGTEINVLLERDINELRSIDKDVAEYIDAFRKGNVAYEAGGGGQYGKIKIIKRNNKSIKDFI